VSLIKKKNPNVTITHCFIHREALVAAVLVDQLVQVMNEVVKVIKRVR